MLNEIVQGIARRLNAAFGDDYEIYQNKVEQGLQEPCFFIAVLQPEAKPLLGNRERWLNAFDVHYFPRQAGSNAELLAVAGQLLAELRFIELPGGGLLRGTSMRWEPVDGVLHFFVNYNALLNRQEEKPLMETLSVEQGLNNYKG